MSKYYAYLCTGMKDWELAFDSNWPLDMEHLDILLIEFQADSYEKANSIFYYELLGELTSYKNFLLENGHGRGIYEAET